MGESIANRSEMSDVKVMGRLVEWYRRMREAGLEFDDLQKPIDNPALRERLVKCWRTNGFNHALDPRIAREMMGPNYFGPSLVAKTFGVHYDEDQLFRLMHGIQIAAEELELCGDNYMLFAGYPFSIKDLIEQRPDLFDDSFKGFMNAGIVTAKVEARWYLLRKSIIPRSTAKDNVTQLGLLKEDEVLPSVNELVYAMVLHYLVKVSYLFPNVYMRCFNSFAGFDRVKLGNFGSEKIDIGLVEDSAKMIEVGITSLRRI